MIDKNIVTKAIKGDHLAFSTLINECKENLYRTAYSYVKDETQALDIVQETVYKAYMSINKLKKPEYFNTWITKILINNSLDQIKKNNKVICLEDKKLNSLLKHKECDFDEKMYIWEAIDSLEEKHKNVIVLKYFNDLTLTEIARVLGHPEGTVKTYLNKGLTKLRTFMRKDVI